MKIDCPHCGVHGSVNDSLAGRKLRCPKCSKVFLVTDDIAPDAERSNLVHQEILHDPSEAPLDASVEQDLEEELEIPEEAVADEEAEISKDDIFDPMPVQTDEEEDLELDDDGEDEIEMSACSECKQSFATEFLVEIDSKLYCALCQPESEEEEDGEESLAFDGDDEDQEGTVEDDDFLAFPGDEDELDDTEPALTPENLEICAGCGEALHPQFLDSYEGQQYCALCLPEDAEENLQLSDDVETEEEEEIELEAGDESEDSLDSATALMDEDDEEESAEDQEVEEEQEDEVDETEEDEVDSDEEELDEEGFLQEACSVCGDKFHRDFLQEIDSKLYCGVCQPEVIETVSADAPVAFGDDEEENEEDVEVVEDEQSSTTDFTVGDTIKEAWQKTKGAKGAVWGGVIAMYLIIFGISFAGFFGIQGFSEQGDPTTAMAANSGLQLVTSWLSMLFAGGLMLIGVRRALEQRVSWKMVFAAFSGKKVLSMTIATVLQILLICIGLVLLVLPGIYLAVGYALTLPLILDRGLGPWEALETSRKAIHKKWWTVLGMSLVMTLLYMVSIIPLGLGLIWTVPMYIVLIGVLYSRLFGFSEIEDDEETVEEDDVEDEEDAFEDFAEESEESL